jgi:hypothetical protein
LREGRAPAVRVRCGRLGPVKRVLYRPRTCLQLGPEVHASVTCLGFTNDPHSFIFHLSAKRRAWFHPGMQHVSCMPRARSRARQARPSSRHCSVFGPAGAAPKQHPKTTPQPQNHTPKTTLQNNTPQNPQNPKQHPKTTPQPQNHTPKTTPPRPTVTGGEGEDRRCAGRRAVRGARAWGVKRRGWER